MNFISYAQNCEDVLLWRALGHIKNGFYIDVGANDPVEHSVTKAFYDRGWYGINIEPLEQHHHAFLDQRPRDVNLCLAAGAEESEITLFDVPSVRGWASSDPAVAAAHTQQGFEVVAHTVQQRTLRSICEEYVSYDIHFLKIDVEGFEAQVLRGMDFSRWRPWVLVIEATMPNSRQTNHETWESMVTDCNYQFAYFDGLNRYYVAHEHLDLLGALQVQANVFDDFISMHLAKSWQDRETERIQAQAAEAQRTSEATARTMEVLLKLVASEERRQAAESQINGLQAGIHQITQDRNSIEASQRAAAAWADELNRQLTNIHSSLSWRLTKPLRLFGRLYAKIENRPLIKRIRNFLRAYLMRSPAHGRRSSQMTNEQEDDLQKLPSQLADIPVSARKVLVNLKRTRNRSLKS